MKCFISCSLIGAILIIISISCISESKKPKIVAVVDKEKIYIDEIDKLIEQELYGELFRIYYLREVTLEEVIDEHIIEKEANKLNITKQDLMKQIFEKNYSKEALNEFIVTNKLDDFGLSDNKNPLQYHDIKSIEGHKILDKRFKEHIRKKYLDSVKQHHSIKIFLESVNPPKQNFNNIAVHYRGNFESEVTLLELSDFECNVCREASPLYLTIYNKYNNKVKFGFLHFSQNVTLSSLASESAGRQGKFWEMHDLLFNSPIYFDSTGYFELANKLELNISQFKLDFRDSAIYNNISNTIQILKEKGFYGTPTVVINGRIIMDSYSSEEIEMVINEELNKYQ